MENFIEITNTSDEQKIAFYKKTYAHVAYGVLVFILIEYLFLNTPAIVKIALSLTGGKMWLLMLGGFMLVTTIAERMATNSTDINKQYLGYFLYILAEAFIFVPLLYIAMSITEGSNLIKQAAILTLALFTGLSGVVFFTKKDFSFLKNIIIIGGFLAMGLIVAGLLFGFDLGLWFSVGMVFLAAASILYQTSKLTQTYQHNQYVAAALGLFASLMLLFWYILRILMSRK
ncbi:MAG TPA: permease [Flavobacteriia bacterium]|jgi:FtsH-binding integral membrane protein|nr:permease [Flavobacteriia bacterium]